MIYQMNDLRTEDHPKEKHEAEAQVNLFQKHSFLNQLTHNMTTDCSLITSTVDYILTSVQEKYKLVMLCTNIVLNAKTKTKNNFCTQYVLNLYFSCTEVTNQ